MQAKFQSADTQNLRRLLQRPRPDLNKLWAQKVPGNKPTPPPPWAGSRGRARPRCSSPSSSACRVVALAYSFGLTEGLNSTVAAVASDRATVTAWK